MPGEYLTLNEASEMLKVSRATLWRRMREGELQTYQSAQDRRVRLVKRSEVEELMRPRPITHIPVEEGKAAA